MWALRCFFTAVGVCAALHIAARVDAAPFSAWSGRYAAPFTAVGACAVPYATARVDATPYNAVGMDVACPL